MTPIAVAEENLHHEIFVAHFCFFKCDYTKVTS